MTHHRHPRALAALAAAQRPPQPPAPPIGASPIRYGNGRIELQLYPAATPEDRIAAAALLLAGTGLRIAPAEPA